MYKAAFTKEFLKVLKKIKKKDITTFERLESKIREIMSQPMRYKPLKGELKGLRRAHVRPFVVVFKVEGDTVVFVSFKHHDKSYSAGV
jgi:YafQ family addiction module toxin component